jgi:hypothetical protein
MERLNSTLKDAKMFSGAVEGNFFQSLDFHEILKSIGWKTVFFKHQTSKAEGTLLAYVMQNMPFYHRFFPSYRVFFGPCVKADGEDSGYKMLDALLSKLCERVKADKGVSLRVSFPLPFPQASNVFFKNGFRRVIVDGEYSVFIDLHADIESLWKGMKRFARRSIKKGIAKGVEIRGIKNEETLKRFYRMYASTAARRSFNPFPYRLFKELWIRLEPKGVVKFFVAYLGNKPIGGVLNTFHGDSSVPYIACSRREFWDCYPNHLLFWHSMKWSKEVAHSSVFKHYHLPAKRKKENGIDYYTFKTCFGGVLTEERAIYLKVFSPMKSGILDTFQRMLQTPFVKAPVRVISKQLTNKPG